MKTEPFSRAAKTLPLLCAMSLCLFLIPMQAPGAGSFPGMRYCSVPPIPGSAVKPNLLLLLDNSASMYDPAYTAPSTYCLDNSYDDSDSYTGYFDRKSVYGYDGAKFVPGATLPSLSSCSDSCAASTSFLHVEMASAVPPAFHRTVSSFKASGNFLNWLSMSKLDLQKRVLTGGKFVSGVLEGETRGCQGKRFIKMIGDDARITFVMRGPVSTDPDFSFETSRGGATRIEIYDKAYKREACLNAVAAWQKKDKAALIAHTNSCMDVKVERLPPPSERTMSSAAQIYNRVMSACYLYLVEKAPMTVDRVLQKQCMSRYHGLMKQDVLSWSDLDGICGRAMKHSPRSAGSSSDSTGFLGQCVDLSNGIWVDSCTRSETEDYCNEIVTPLVTDPSTTANMTGTDANVPGFVLDAGISNLGKVSGTFNARVVPGSAPTGLLQEFSDGINFGAMVFNANGAAGLECTSGKLQCLKHCGLDTGRECSDNSDCTADYGTCAASRCSLNASLACAKDHDCIIDSGPCEGGRDGGKIISYLNHAASPLGDHATGLIAAIDGVTATTWTPFAESFYNAMGYFARRDDLRLQEADFDKDHKPAPSRFNCQKNNVLIVSDGMSTADRHPDVARLVDKSVKDWATMPSSKTSTGNNAPPSFQGSYNLDDLAWIARNKNLADFAQPILNNGDYLSTYVVYTGVPCGDYDADGSCKTGDEGVPEKMMQLTAAKGGGKFASAKNSADLEKAFHYMLQQIAGGSGTNASILSTGESNGAIFLQEQFYPTKSFDGGKTSASWIGEMQSLWYYIDPFIGSTPGAGSTIREDTGTKLKLDLKSDLIVTLGFDARSNRSYAYLMQDSNGDGLGDTIPAREARFITDMPAQVAAEDLNSLWRAGRKLWLREPSDRRIYTHLDGTSLSDFTGNALATGRESVQRLFQATSEAEANAIIDYVRGSDSADFRERSVAVPGLNQGRPSVWKLGDIISSTPQVQSPKALGSYNLASPKGYSDASYLRFMESDRYKNRGMVYVGANDGMLHAFTPGKLASGVSGHAKAALHPKAGETEAELGKEEWAFIPRNALPYLTYLKEPAYQHLYYVDGGITLADVSIGDITGNLGCVKGSYWNCPKTSYLPGTRIIDTAPGKNTWRTVLIGGMGLGGASCLSGAGGDCVPAPLADPPNPVKGVGYSSYFALDVTDPSAPSLLWEFSHPDLGYATSGPAIVRVGDPGVNGRWFAVFGSGPTGPIDTTRQQFLGRSNRNLKFFVVDLRSGELLQTIDTAIASAFAGSMTGGAIDADRGDPTSAGKYQDDAIYVGYAMKPSGTGAEGGVVRIVTNESDLQEGAKAWTWSTVIDGVGPVTSAVSRLQDKVNNNLWLYFGTGRYFFTQDDMLGPRALYGVKEPCYNFKPRGVDNKLNKLDPLCADSVPVGRLIDQTIPGNEPAVEHAGWRINLDPPPEAGTAGAERLVTNPTSATSGAVFFTTFQPSTDLCLFGNSYLWAVRYDTGLAIEDGLLQGKVLVQLATGSLQETGLSSGNFDGKYGRRGKAMKGKPGGLKVVSNSGLKPLKKIIHIQER